MPGFLLSERCNYAWGSLEMPLCWLQCWGEEPERLFWGFRLAVQAVEPLLFWLGIPPARHRIPAKGVRDERISQGMDGGRSKEIL